MSFSPDRYTNKLVVPIGIIFVLIIAGVAMTVNSQNLLKKQESAVAPYFSTVKKYTKDIRIPRIEVLGPKGEPVDISDEQRGRLMVLNVWATWCAPCVRELGELERMSRARRLQGVKVIAVSIDLPKNLEKVLNFIQKYNVADVAGYHDYKGGLQSLLPVKNLPVTFIVAPNGAILYEITGDACWSHPGIIEFLSFLDNLY